MQIMDIKKSVWGNAFFVYVTNKPPAMRVIGEGYTKNSNCDTIRVFKPII